MKRSVKWVAWTLVMLVTLVGYCSRFISRDDLNAVPHQERRVGTTIRVDTSIGFENPRKLAEHYQKHGAEFGAQSQDEYLRMATALRDKPAGGEVLELVRDDGVTCRFDRSSGAFLAFNRDRTIRTFFRPNDGENYFRRQAKR